jgi:hypothetical protein
MAVEQIMAAEPERVVEQEEQPEEEEKYITLKASNLLHFQDTLVDIRSQIAYLQRDARQDRIKIQGMF